MVGSPGTDERQHASDGQRFATQGRGDDRSDATAPTICAPTEHGCKLQSSHPWSRSAPRSPRTATALPTGQRRAAWRSAPSGMGCPTAFAAYNIGEVSIGTTSQLVTRAAIPSVMSWSPSLNVPAGSAACPVTSPREVETRAAVTKRSGSAILAAIEGSMARATTQCRSCPRPRWTARRRSRRARCCR